MTVIVFLIYIKKPLQNVKPDVCEVCGDREVKDNWLYKCSALTELGKKREDQVCLSSVWDVYTQAEKSIQADAQKTVWGSEDR